MSEEKKLDTLWYTRCAVPSPLGIAIQLGWLDDEFREDGIAIQSLLESKNVVERESHYDHSVRNSFRLGGNIPGIWSRSIGRDTRLIGLSWTDEFQALIALPASGIHSIEDLRGRRLGLPEHNSSIIDVGRASALRGFLTALELAGISRSEVEFIDLPEERSTIADQGAKAISGSHFAAPRRRAPSASLYALVRREVDVIYVKGPKGLQLTHQLGAHVVADLGAHPDPLVRTNNCTPRTFTVDGSLLDNRLDLVSRVMARVVSASHWAQLNADQAVSLIGKETNDSDTWVRYGYGANVHQNLGVDLNERSIDALDRFKRFLFDWGFLPENFDTQAWIDPRPLADYHRHPQRVA